MEKKFVVGDEVTWNSQAAGSATTKVGRVIEVVPPKEKPQTKLKDIGMYRDHESYVVRASYVNLHGTKKTGLYWPRVTKLGKVTF